MKRIITVLLMGILVCGVFSGCESEMDKLSKNNADLVKSADHIIDTSHKKIKAYNTADKLFGN